MDLPDTAPSAVVMADWFQREEVAEVRAIPGGFSGSRLWRVSLVDGTCWALRHWPPATTGTRVAQVHQIVERVRTRGLTLVPYLSVALSDGRTYQSRVGYWWDCQQWIEGGALGGDEDLGAACEQAARAAAVFVEAARSGGVASFDVPRFGDVVSETGEWLESGPLTGRSQTAMSRVVKARELQASISNYGDSLLRLAADHLLSKHDSRLVNATRSWLYFWQEQQSALKSWLARIEDQSLSMSWILGDFHLGNCLFASGRLVGVIDFDAVRWDSPACDLARLFGSCQMLAGERIETLDRTSIWRRMLAVYRSIRPLNEEEEEFAGGLVHWSPVITLGNWIQWVLVQKHSFFCSNEEILQRIQGWHRVVVHQASSPF